MKPTPDTRLFRGVSYPADQKGCGQYRMHWPIQIINANSKEILIESLSSLIPLPAFYERTNGVRFQRLTSLKAAEFLKTFSMLKDQINPVLNLMYDIDDVVLPEDIPDYNASKYFFEDKRDTIITCMKEYCNEITVPSKAMADYYKDKTGNNNVTVIPNYVPKFWGDRFYRKQEVVSNFLQNKHKPVVVFPCSGSHFNVDNSKNQSDDFSHINEAIAKNVDNFKFIFLGGAYPKALEPLIKRKKILSIVAAEIYDYFYYLNALKPNVIAAPLQDNVFNKCKSDIKYSEACALGLPLVCQDLEPYKKCKYATKFKTGDEFIDALKKVTKDESSYVRLSDRCVNEAKDLWLENDKNWKKFEELYIYPYKHKGRKLINSMSENR